MAPPKGFIPWNKGKKLHYPVWATGKKFSDELKRKLSLAHLGHKASPETRLKMSKVHKERGTGKWMKGRIGPLSPSWRGGRAYLNSSIRLTEPYKQWRREILLRDRYACVLCGDKKSKFEVDHYPVSFSDILTIEKIKEPMDALNSKMLWDRNNGRVLCIKCHNTTRHGRPKYAS